MTSSVDRRQIDSVKEHFAGKSNGELQTIVKLRDRERWSDAALIAAEEVLDDREQGKASEPIVAEEVRTPFTSQDYLRHRSKFVLLFLGAAFGWWLANSDLIFQIRVKHSVAIDPVNMFASRTELPSELNVYLFGNRIHGATGSSGEINSEGKSISWGLTIGFAIACAIGGVLCHAVGWKIIDSRN